MGGFFIAVTAPERDDVIGMPGVVVERGYLEAASVAGGVPLVLSPAMDPETRDRLFRQAAGLMLTGGEDLDPARYGEDPLGVRRFSPSRDAMEIELVHRALESRMPVLAICRGVQLLNVALGGTLYQDLLLHWSDEIDHDRYREFDGSIHAIRPDGAMQLAGVLAAGEFDQNSAHHQGIKDLAPGLHAAAHAPDGLVEAVEWRETGAAWTVGVQWHPERKLSDVSGTNRRLFQRFGTEIRRAGVGASRP